MGRKFCQMRNNEVFALSLYPGLDVLVEEKFIKINAVLDVESGPNFSEKIIPAYPIFVAREKNQFRILNPVDLKAEAYFKYYSGESQLQVYLVSAKHIQVVDIFSNFISPLVGGKFSPKEAFEKILDDENIQRFLVDRMRVKPAKAGSDLIFNLESFHDLVGANLFSLSTLNRWLASSKRTGVSLPQQLAGHKQPNSSTKQERPGQPTPQKEKPASDSFIEEDALGVSRKNLEMTVKSPRKNKGEREFPNDELIGKVFEALGKNKAYEKKWNSYSGSPLDFADILGYLERSNSNVISHFEHRLRTLDSDSREFSDFVKNFIKFIQDNPVK